MILLQLILAILVGGVYGLASSSDFDDSATRDALMDIYASTNGPLWSWQGALVKIGRDFGIMQMSSLMYRERL